MVDPETGECSNSDLLVPEPRWRHQSIVYKDYLGTHYILLNENINQRECSLIGTWAEISVEDLHFRYDL